ncbi:nuclease-related domain-containing protein [Rathayibacter sp. VKM Ac-2928]|uniref:nuclease-related domain-containing protein n=1 Tax=Rathayibacter sp. VKM Ac-2928 TaxID=2929479 RepID=UPI001FB47E94|nr:nuclease-related domain-containing protein [Rathayibacter sp. VKM Ac-2928]MCJ1685367.1 NERD domain-containing protein [Rathayibacter sp. VKM Ac-2928]
MPENSCRIERNNDILRLILCVSRPWSGYLVPTSNSDERELDVRALVSQATEQGASVAEWLSDAAADTYQAQFPDSMLVEFRHHGASYLFDMETDRSVLVCGTPSAPPRSREASYQRGHPIPETCAGRPLDRGHFFPHASGGGYGPNLFPQDRALNRGWSVDGREYRALERRAVASPAGSLFFARPIYEDLSAMPARIQLGLVSDGSVDTRTFQNRFDAVATGDDELAGLLAGATDAQIGGLGEETVAALLEEEMGATIVALGDSGLPRTAGRQDLDLVAIMEGELVVFEVKTRFRSQLAGRLTQAGNLLQPRLRRGGKDGRQASQAYLAERLSDVLDIDEDFAGVEVRVAAVDLVLMLVQFFAVDDAGRHLQALDTPLSCAEAADVAYKRIISHRGHL